MEFTKKDASKLKRIGTSWRRPRGRKNKTKVGKKGHRPLPSSGYKTKGSERNRISGKVPVRVYAPSQVQNLNADNNIVIIASSVGNLKRMEIMKVCSSKNIKVFNAPHIKSTDTAAPAGDKQ
jgi:large subunit ribosomal protein L32e